MRVNVATRTIMTLAQITAAIPTPNYENLNPHHRITDLDKYEHMCYNTW
jgi:hypothetical protein